MGDNDGETLANVVKGEYDFDYSEFEDVSDEAKDLISKLLIKDKRYHTWLLLAYRTVHIFCCIILYY